MFPLTDANDPTALPSGWQYIPQRWDLLLVAGIILIGGWSLGHILLRLIRLPLEIGGVERTVFAIGVGLSALSLITLGCGLAGWLSRGVFLSVILVSLFVECLLRIRGRARHSSSDGQQPADLPTGGNCRRTRKFQIATLLIVSPFVMAMLLGSMLPSTDFDVKEYHLQGPKEFFQAGQIRMLPHNVYTNFPFLTEMLSLLAMVPPR